jgi:hypothetical protein
LDGIKGIDLQFDLFVGTFKNIFCPTAALSKLNFKIAGMGFFTQFDLQLVINDFFSGLDLRALDFIKIELEDYIKFKGISLMLSAKDSLWDLLDGLNLDMFKKFAGFDLLFKGQLFKILNSF